MGAAMKLVGNVFGSSLCTTDDDWYAHVLRYADDPALEVTCTTTEGHSELLEQLQTNADC